MLFWFNSKSIFYILCNSFFTSKKALSFSINMLTKYIFIARTKLIIYFILFGTGKKK